MRHDVPLASVAAPGHIPGTLNPPDFGTVAALGNPSSRRRLGIDAEVPFPEVGHNGRVTEKGDGDGEVSGDARHAE